ncbi:GntR family transcriptional regulator [Acuticoccus sp. MNP-M23]|uniref:GntR family transcriptional regulator n=1 Tax=Acuticoccus sp. MNP-M23 TaxID=3072793 RepID=UPI002815B94B|nr:GntR family transcriptional regulator [Acuticoccus sp. MNP-M23]WMS41437.1 GntR family transcriptional regulator [Acuticoccus sp. MNP-M23]
MSSVKNAAYERFQQALLEGKLRPGQLLSQKDLVSLLALSIGALRELLPRLQAEGLLTVMPQRGIQITVIDLPMIRDAFQMRIALEREAVISALKTLPDAVLLEQRERHIAVVERVRTAPTEADLDAGQSLDTEFHDLLIGSTGNEVLIGSYNVNSSRIRLIKLDRIKLSATTLPSAFADHLAVIDALLARDRERSIAAIEAHIRNARERAIDL